MNNERPSAVIQKPPTEADRKHAEMVVWLSDLRHTLATLDCILIVMDHHSRSAEESPVGFAATRDMLIARMKKLCNNCPL